VHGEALVVGGECHPAAELVREPQPEATLTRSTHEAGERARGADAAIAYRDDDAIVARPGAKLCGWPTVSRHVRDRLVHRQHEPEDVLLVERRLAGK